MKNKPVILKLGGSVITKKDETLTPNLQAITRLSQEIFNANPLSIIIVHGGGSYGHPIAKKYDIAQGLKEESQIFGFSEIHEAMVSLNKLVVESLMEKGLPAFGMAPSSFIVTKKGRIQVFEEKPLMQALKLGLIPILYGDAVLDYEQGFAILSGDQIASTLAVKTNAKKLIMGVDVDGLYTANPKTDPSARLIPHLTLESLQQLKNKIGGANVTDVTGGMLGKVLELTAPIEHEVEVMIVNALKPYNIYKALKGEEVIGTKIVKE